jgi:hypothetical protein
VSGPLPYAVATAGNAPGYAGGPSGAASVPPSAQGNGWEICVRAAGDYTTLLAVIPQSMLLSFQFVRQLDDIGSGTVILSQDDPWWRETALPGGLPTETLLDEECLWQFSKDGTVRHEFLGETVTEQLADDSEQRQVTVTGPGTLAALKWAMVAPQGFPEIVLKLDGILDSFDEVDDTGASVVDTNIWTTLSPADHVYITPIANIYSYPGGTGYNLGTLFPSGSLTVEASPSTTFLGASPYDATDTLISAQVTPIGVSSSSTDSSGSAAYGSGLNGSELTQFYIQSNYNPQNYALIGLSATAFYGQLGSKGSVQTKIFPAYDSQNHSYWMITEQAGTGGGPGTFYFWTSSDGQSWTLQWQGVHSWDATSVTFYVAAYYSADKTESVVLTDLNSNVTTPSYQGSLYLGMPLMAVWLDQFNAAQARGTVPFITSNVSAGEDSYGRAWTDTQNVQATNGTDLYTLLQSGCSVVNADYVMNPGFQLQVGQPATGQVALGVDRSGYIILREGYDTAARQRVRARDQIQTLIGGENSDGHEIAAYTTTYISKWGQREGWFQAAVQVDPVSMAYATAAVLAENETEVLSWTFTVVPNLPGKTIFDNFDVGDWLGIERPDFSATDTVRVTAIAVSVDSSGTESHELTFVSYMQWLADQLQYISNKLGGTFVNSQGTSPVAPSKYGTGQVPTYFTPAATLQGLADVATHAAQSGLTSSPLVYSASTGTYQTAGSTDAVTGETVQVPGQVIADGTIEAAKIVADAVIAGAVDGTVITGATFVADGTGGEFLAYSGTPGPGNLIMSFAASAGTDTSGNAYDAGFWVYGNLGSAVGMIPSGSNTALALIPGVTPAPVAGTALLYGASSGTAQLIDGADGMTYGVARRSLALNSDSGALTSLSVIFTSQVSVRTYRFHAVLFVTANSTGAEFVTEMAVPAGADGQMSVTVTRSGTFYGSVAGGINVNAGVAVSLPAASGYSVTIDGIMALTASGSLNLKAGSLTASSLVVNQWSMLDILPV